MKAKTAIPGYRKATAGEIKCKICKYGDPHEHHKRVVFYCMFHDNGSKWAMSVAANNTCDYINATRGKNGKRRDDSRADKRAIPSA